MSATEKITAAAMSRFKLTMRRLKQLRAAAAIK
jgi:hypothetical protein